jgi:dihydrofolate synthase/folylpolyglutamate synthase
VSETRRRAASSADPVERLLGLARFERSGMRPGLERIEALLAELGHPEAGLRILHVGGTNGKGSVSALSEAILRAGGFRTGLYTSPHLLDPTERIRIDGVPITRAALAAHAGALQSRIEAAGITFFEGMTAVALSAFREAGVEAAVLEVGLGGRWDATTVGAPLVSVLTRIDYDHQEYLGTRLGEIAAEKAAIIRGGVAVSAAQAPEAADVIEARCREIGVPLLVAGRELRVQARRSDLRGHRLDLEGPGWALADVDLALPGLFQPANAALAVGAVRVFARSAGVAVPDPAIRTGAASVRWPGRFQVIQRPAGGPTVVLDGAHNPGGAAALAASLQHLFPGARMTLVLGISADKDRAGILKALAPVATRLILTRAAHPRATPPADLAGALPPVDTPVAVEPDLSRALALALADPAAGVVCVAGSLFLVADALRWLAARGIAGEERHGPAVGQTGSGREPDAPG